MTIHERPDGKAQHTLKLADSLMKVHTGLNTFLKPDYMKAYYREGMCQQELGNWEEAAQAYFEGCRLENENAELIKRFQHAMRMAKEDHKARANQ